MPRRATSAAGKPRATARLSKDGIVAAAVQLADREGLAGLSMRRLAQHLEVDAMSLYYHVRDKGTLLAAMADAVVASIATEKPAVAPAGIDSVAAVDGLWTDRLRALIMQARRTMLRHPWAARVLAERDTPTPAVLAHLERMLAVMRDGGCSLDLCHHAIHLFGSRILGFGQDLFDDAPAGTPTPADGQAQAFAATMPHIAELAAAVTHDGALGGCDDDGEFAFALDLLLDGLERRRLAA
ncbi:TetR/AcrR family transcriptional regulator [Actinoplanes sp. N902-109]|uniref:TetR/AcrR family transcriptional regulator n=1 Tax=Actinoplanes sp. (strain N902-109) TaxID=649831 RepID=UPI00032949B1|nr:TetR/AcrR family transcriptional regulator [Actinoplanes sp. N902-109]AGL18538.1 TetR family transcriptional regulator [Actinoplanes sp. N902-109]